MYEQFPKKKAGDSLSAKHVNALSDAARLFSGAGAGSNLSGRPGYSAAPSPFMQRVLIVTDVRDDVSGDEESSVSSSSSSSSSGSDSHAADWPCPGAKYMASPRYFDFTSNSWLTNSDEGPYCLDASEFGDTLEVGDVVVGFWDVQRGMFVGRDSRDSRVDSIIDGSIVISGSSNVDCNPAYCLHSALGTSIDDCDYCSKAMVWVVEGFVGGCCQNMPSSSPSGTPRHYLRYVSNCVWRSTPFACDQGNSDYNEETDRAYWELVVGLAGFGAGSTLSLVFPDGSTIVYRKEGPWCCTCNNKVVITCETAKGVAEGYITPCTTYNAELCVSPYSGEEDLPCTHCDNLAHQLSVTIPEIGQGYSSRGYPPPGYAGAWGTWGSDCIRIQSPFTPEGVSYGACGCCEEVAGTYLIDRFANSSSANWAAFGPCAFGDEDNELGSSVVKGYAVFDLGCQLVYCGSPVLCTVMDLSLAIACWRVAANNAWLLRIRLVDSSTQGHVFSSAFYSLPDSSGQANDPDADFDCLGSTVFSKVSESGDCVNWPDSIVVSGV